jgi:hypothetical protein
MNLNEKPPSQQIAEMPLARPHLGRLSSEENSPSRGYALCALESVQLRSAGFPTGETCRLETRHCANAVHGKFQAPTWDAHRSHEPSPACSADFPVCCVTGFQTRGASDSSSVFSSRSAADLEVGDTAGLETCATVPFMGKGKRPHIASSSFHLHHSCF